MRLVLASASPQRAAILADLGIAHDVAPVDVDEVATGDPLEAVAENARRKARAGLARHPDALVLGADTVVALGERLLGKPVDAVQARAWLEALSGRTHRVVGGLCLAEPGRERERTCVTEVTFRVLDAAAVGSYLATGEWRDRAGAYAIQGDGAALVDAVDGDRANVVGLCVPALLEAAPELRNRP